MQAWLKATVMGGALALPAMGATACNDPAQEGSNTPACPVLLACCFQLPGALEETCEAQATAANGDDLLCADALSLSLEGGHCVGSGGGTTSSDGISPPAESSASGGFEDGAPSDDGYSGAFGGSDSSGWSYPDDGSSEGYSDETTVNESYESAILSEMAYESQQDQTAESEVSEDSAFSE